MKFTSGYWRVADGFQVSYGQQVHDVVREERSLTAHVPTKRVESRRNTLNNPVITVTCTSPLPGVIGVRITHHAGGVPRRPSYALDSRDDHPVDIAVDAATASLTSAELSVQIALEGDWRMTFSTPSGVLTSSSRKSLGYVTATDGRRYVHERLALDVGECVYGLGERSTAFVKNGQSIDMWNDDGGPSSYQAYKNVPFYLTSRGYGVFVATSGPVSYEVGSEFISQVQFAVPGEELSYYVIAGDNPKEILDRYTRLTGRPALPPAWSFGLWLSTSFVTSYSEQAVMELVDGMRQRELPMSVFHFDSFWMREFHWCDFEWDPRRFPDPAGMLRRLKERGLRASVWINPYVAQQSSLFAEGTERGYFLTLEDGSVWQTDTWQAGMAIVDFTNPSARRWYQDKLRALLNQGVDCFKTDFGERIPVNVRYFDGSDPVLMHNYYSYLYNQAVFEVIREHGGEPVLFARAATAGGQRFPVHWGGDPEPTYVSMSETLRGGLSLGLCGFGFWSHDIGGFEGTPDAGLFMRWAALGLLSSHSRLHGAINYRVPWAFGDQAVAVVRSFSMLKMRLMPYLLAAAHEASAGGVPMMRAMMLEFPDDPSCLHLDRQYMLGPDLLVAPVFTDDGTVTYYVPDGEWLGLESGLPVRGPGWQTERHGYHSLPLLVRPGAVIPMGAAGVSPEYDYSDGAVLVIGALTEEMDREVPIEVPDESGHLGEARQCRFTVNYRAGRLLIAADTQRPWTALLLGRQSAARCAGGSFAQEAPGLRILPASPAGTVEVTF